MTGSWAWHQDRTDLIQVKVHRGDTQRWRAPKRWVWILTDEGRYPWKCCGWVLRELVPLRRRWDHSRDFRDAHNQG
jgi:hypothetical protein